MTVLSNSKIIPLIELESLASKASDYARRYDIPEEVYQRLLKEQEFYYEFLQDNPKCYGNKKDWEQANVHNRFICLMLMLRISEFMESRYKAG
jgi:hypothetical protein